MKRCQPNGVWTGSLTEPFGEAEDRLARGLERAVGLEFGDGEHRGPAPLEAVGDGSKVLAFRDPLRALPDQRLVLGVDLDDRAPLRHIELVDPRLVFGIDVLVAQLDLRDHVLGGELHEHRAAPLGRHEGRRVLIVIGLDGGLARLGEAGHAAGGDQRELGAPLLGPVAVNGVDERFRNIAVAADGAQDLVAEQVDADQVLVLGPRHVVAFEHEIVELGVELPLLVAEGGRVRQLLHDAGVRRAQPKPGGLGIEQVLADEEVKDLARKPGLVGLVAGEIGAAGAFALALQGALELAVEQDRGDVDLAHGRDR